MKDSNNSVKTERIEGTIHHVVYESADDGYCVLKVDTGQKYPITIVGHCAQPNVGQHIAISGHWIENNQYGKQFKADTIITELPKSKAAILDYLSSGVIRGIGKQTAELLLKHFGTDILNILSNTPDELRKIPGIGKKKCQQIADSWKTQQGASDVMIFLQSHQIGPARAIKIYKKYGTGAIDIIRDNPYTLYQDIPGIGFHLADKMAQSLGLDKNHPKRIQNGIFFVLQEHASNGHTTLFKQQIITQSCELLGVEIDQVKEQIAASCEENQIIETTVNNETLCSLTSLYEAEQSIAEKLVRMCQHTSHLPSYEKLNHAVAELTKSLGYVLSEEQQQALRTILGNKICVLTGGPGVGKTTLVQSIVYVLQKSHTRFILCAPTGRAARRLKESTGHEAKTVHRALGIDPISKQFQHNKQNPINTEYCIIDESSMLDVHIMKHILSALPDHCGLLLVGDIDQLPSVGAGNILSDIIGLKRVPVVKLTQVFRQAQTSLIIRFAHQVREGVMPNFQVTDTSELQDCYGIFVKDNDKVISKIQHMISQRIPEKFSLDPIRDIQILCPMQKGKLGAVALNKSLQSHLNQNNVLLQSHGLTLRLNDKVMQTRNNYEKDVFNGDIGYICGHNEEKQTISIMFEDKVVDYFYDELEEITLAYAMTIHKSQGSEFKAVIIPLTGEHYVMLERNLVYTAMTRAKQLLIIIGDQKALRIATQKQSAKTRMTLLEHMLDQQFMDSL
jgi:exodeoxyribonuclease V alpha subunit